MIQKTKEQFTKYETARIIGARALQIAMDAPLLLKIQEEKLKEVKFDPLKMAELEFQEGVLPITIHRPTPRRGKDKLGTIKEETVSDEELVEKAKELEKEIIENPEEYSLVDDDEGVELEPTDTSEEAQ